MAKTDLSLEGFEELEAALDALIELSSNGTGKGALQRALNKAAKPILDAAKTAAPDGPTGNLKESIVVSRKVTDSARPTKIKNGVGVYVRTTAPHAHLVEFGTGPRHKKSTGQYVGEMPPNPFMSEAFDSNVEEVVSDLSETVMTEIEKTYARAQKRAAKKAAKS